MTIEKLKALEPIFGTWYVDSKIAEGRHSKVFKVYKTVNGVTEFLALKTLKFPANDKELSRVIESGKYKTVGEYLETIENAVTDNMNRMLALRNCPNIVRFDNFTIVKESSCFYVVMLMELLSPFSEKVRVNDITTEQAVKICCDLCSAAEGFRSIGIMHHQIKPENIYVDSEGNFKLGDFGISNIAGRGKTEASPYMAPEVYKEAAYDTTSDIYAIGVLLYKLLNNNRLPFLPEYPNPVSLSDREIAFEKQMRGESIPAPANADAEMARLISKALAHRQSDRFFSPLLMKAELGRYMEIISEPEEQSYQSAPQPPVYIPVVPASPVAGFQISDEEEDEEPSIYLRPDTAVSEAEKNAFRETFKESAEEDEDDGKDNKKIYLLVAAVIAIIALIIGVIFLGRGSDSPKATTLPTTVPPTVSTTVPSTAATTVPPTVPTTTEPTTTEATTETTTEPTTTETTTQPTTAPTTEPTTAYTGTPELVISGYSDGDISADGKVYTSIEDYTIIQTPDTEFFDEVILEISTPLGENVSVQGSVFIYEMSGASIIQKTAANLEIALTESDGEPLICCYITVDDGDFYYSPEYYQYYVCLEEGALASDGAISLPLQLQI